MSVTLYAERYNDAQIRNLYERPPFGEPALLDNQLIVGPAGVGKTHLLRNLAMREWPETTIAVYVDLPESGVAQLSEEIPYEKPEILFPIHADYIAAGTSALCRSVLRASLEGLAKLGLESRGMIRDLAMFLGVAEERLAPSKTLEATHRLLSALQSGVVPPTDFLGAKSPGFATLCESLAAGIRAHYGARTIFLLDQLDAIPPALQEQVVDVLRRENKASYMIATRPCPGAPEESSNLRMARPGDFGIFSARTDEVSLTVHADFLARLAYKLQESFGIRIPRLSGDVAQYAAWASGGSTRTAVALLLEIESLRQQYARSSDEIGDVRLDVGLIEAALKNVALTESKTLRAMGRTYIQETKRIFNRWTGVALSRYSQGRRQLKRMSVSFDTDEYGPNLGALMRIAVKENLLQFVPGDAWDPGTLPKRFAVNPLLLFGGGLAPFMGKDGESFEHHETVRDLAGYFTFRRGARRVIRRRDHATMPTVFVSTRLPGPTTTDARRSPLIRLLEEHGEGRFKLSMGTDIAGAIIARVEEKIREATLAVVDLTEARPDVLAELGIAIASEVPVVFVVATNDDRGRLPMFLREYGVHAYSDRPAETYSVIEERLNSQPTGRERWRRGADDVPLVGNVRLRDILVLAPSELEAARAIVGAVDTAARQNGFYALRFIPTPNSNVALDELIRAVSRAARVFIDFAGISDFEYAAYAGIATGLAYRWRERRVLGRTMSAPPVLYASVGGRETIVPGMLRRLLVSEPDMAAAVTSRVTAFMKGIEDLRRKR